MIMFRNNIQTQIRVKNMYTNLKVFSNDFVYI